MRKTTFNPEDMPILNLDTSGTSPHEASRFLDSSEIMAAYIAESMQNEANEWDSFIFCSKRIEQE